MKVKISNILPVACLLAALPVASISRVGQAEPVPGSTSHLTKLSAHQMKTIKGGWLGSWVCQADVCYSDSGGPGTAGPDISQYTCSEDTFPLACTGSGTSTKTLYNPAKACTQATTCPDCTCLNANSQWCYKVATRTDSCLNNSPYCYTITGTWSAYGPPHNTDVCN